MKKNFLLQDYCRYLRSPRQPSTWICNRGLSACRRCVKFLNLPSVIKQMKTLEEGIFLPIQLSKENLRLLLTILDFA